MPARELRGHLVVHVASEEIADVLMPWPATRDLIQERLGPTALAVAAAAEANLREQLRLLGMETRA